MKVRPLDSGCAALGNRASQRGPEFMCGVGGGLRSASKAALSRLSSAFKVPANGSRSPDQRDR